MKRSLHSLCILVATVTSNTALADDGCGRFAWPVTQEREALTAPTIPVLPSGSLIDPAQVRAFKLGLREPADANFVMPPERKPRIETWSGSVVHFPASLRAGGVPAHLVR